MAYAQLMERANALFEEAPYVIRIRNEADYLKAKALAESLFEDSENDNEPLLELTLSAIENWEDNAPEFAAFNERIRKLDGVDTLLFLMEQHGLGVADLPEIGGKSLVSRIGNRERSLTAAHIKALSERFGVSPAVFF